MKKHSVFVLYAFLIVIWSPFFSFGQAVEKKTLTYGDFALWKTIDGASISNNGQLAAFEINPQHGDGNLVLKYLEGKKNDTLARGYDAKISPDNDYLVYKIKTPLDTLRAAKIKKLKKEQMPQDSLGVLILKSHKVYTYPRLKSYDIPEENARWIAFLTTPEKKKDEKPDDKRKKGWPKAEETSTLVLLNTATADTLSIQHVSDFHYARKGHSISYVVTMADSMIRSDVYIFDTESGKSRSIFSGAGTVKQVTTDDEGGKYAFLFSPDTTKNKTFAMYFGSLILGNPVEAVNKSTQGMPIGWAPSENGELKFSQNGQRIFFGTARIPAPEPKDTLADDEKATLDVWSWQDMELQSEQKMKVDKEKKRTYLAVYLIEKQKFIQLADPMVRDVKYQQKGNGKYALGKDETPYKLSASWTGLEDGDYYLIDIETGIKRLVVKAKSLVTLSPQGNYVLWFDPADSSYYARSTVLTSAEVLNLTKNIPVAFYDERKDVPTEANPYGIAGWAEGDRAVFIYDRYDIWRLDPDGSKVPVNATRNFGRKNFVKLRYVKLDPEEENIDTSKPVLLSAFDERSKSSGFFVGDFRSYIDPRMLTMDAVRFGNPKKAKNADQLIWTRESVDEFPDYWLSASNFEKPRKITDANPQQKKYKWCGVRLVHWRAFSGEEMEGLLYFPNNIDLGKKYPMIVYFYERNADNLHQYSAPAPSRSTINKTFFVSNDYLVFVPDITYTEGYPGQSAFNAVISGTQFVCNMFQFVDRDRIGIQGQSWGGYQTAWLITQTNMFAAAMAGAPVSNMTSAYGGIRWESGLSRMFQYEREQSRIGASLWDKPLNYIENSPLFFAPKIQTPLLIMHNDNDGAVPWYQGIELFTALRRLRKPVWMLTYNNEPHNLKAESWGNRMDLTIRMKGFFDHYLKGEPMPEWMRFGIPATRKGLDLGY